ncbi:unnamed protein product [Blepharisma stoltei]|uniref:Autophagy-related protein n=1 Tax=Blepharisma stoltei TaxID=1481888 RepID=A0AAU9JBV4_9CILI|nr:unnamed protein product [Blepharisma stoltei]
MNYFQFKLDNKLSRRSTESSQMLQKFPSRIPIVLEKAWNSRLSQLPKSKFMCPGEYTEQQFVTCVRKKLALGSETALFVFVNGVDLIAGNSLMSDVYNKEKDDDGFLYMVYCEQDVLGGN